MKMMDEKPKELLTVKSVMARELEIGREIWRLQDARQRTIQVLEGANNRLINWRLPQENHDIGSLLYHIAAIELSWLFEEILEQPFPPEAEEYFPYPVRDEQGHLFKVRETSLEDHLRRLQVVRGLLVDSLKVMSVEDFRRPRQLPEYDVAPEWVIHHLTQHEAEHRSEIAGMLLAAQAAMDKEKFSNPSGK
jgi:hypothetical protein